MRVLGVLLIAGCGRIGFAHAPDAAAPEIAGLVVHLPLDTLDITTTPDASGNGHNGHCDAASDQCPTIVAGKLGNAFAFDGVAERIAVDDAAALDLPGGFTVAAWILTPAPQTGTGCPYQKPVGTLDRDSWELCIDQNLSAFYFTSQTTASGNGDELDTAGPISLGAWHHTAITWDGALRRKEIWLDGLRIAQNQQKASTPLFDAQSILLGLDIDNSATNAEFAGLIDDFRIYDRALTPDELATLAAP